MPTVVDIPSDVSFTVVQSEVIPGITRSLEVRINKRVSEDVLRAIALKLRAQDSSSYQRTFIAYLLPGMKSGEGAWATTHFNPGLKVRILGLSADQARSLTAESGAASQSVIGSWLDETPGLSRRIVIYRAKGKVYARQTFKDGSADTSELVERHTAKGQRFQEKRPANPRAASESGDHWLLGVSGDLEIRDNEGLIRTARKLTRR